MNIAVIDDGINIDCFPSLGNLIYDLRVNSKGKVVSRQRKALITKSHGTICAAIIKRYAPLAKIGSIQVLTDENDRGDPKWLAAALRWCSEQRIPLINLSVGSTLLRDVDSIQSATHDALHSGAVIVAALANTNRFSIPACLEGVIGVRTSSILVGGQYEPIEGGLFEVPFAASSRHKLTDYLGKTQVTPLCNSFAAPLITAKLYKPIQQNPNLDGPGCIRLLGGGVHNRAKRLKNTSFLGGPPTIPVIQILGNPKETIPILERMRSLLQRLGYACLIIDRTDERFLLSKAVPPHCYFGYLDRYLEPDLILTSFPWDQADGSIYVNSEIKNVRYCEDSIYVPPLASDYVLRKIVRHFENQPNNY